MANSNTHVTVGAGIGSLTYLLICWFARREFDWVELIGAAAFGGLAGLLPDILEPATSPNHRRFFHSVTTLALVGAGAHRVVKSPSLTSGAKTVILVPAVAYASHLLLDCTTPKSLPLI